MKTLYHKSGFALVTVLILLVGLSLAGSGLTYKLIYETRLVDSWQVREVANTTAETGLESAKRWLESELDKGTVFSEGSVIKADDGSPNYCLKGFKVDEITSLKTETALLSTELDDENFKNYSYEYYIEDVSNQYQQQSQEEAPDDAYIYLGDNTGKNIHVYDLNGEPAEKHRIRNDPSYKFDNGKEQRGFGSGHFHRPFIVSDGILYNEGENWSTIYTQSIDTGELIKQYKYLGHNYNPMLIYKNNIFLSCSDGNQHAGGSDKEIYGRYTCIYPKTLINFPKYHLKYQYETAKEFPLIEHQNNRRHPNIPDIRYHHLEARGISEGIGSGKAYHIHIRWFGSLTIAANDDKLYLGTDPMSDTDAIRIFDLENKGKLLAELPIETKGGPIALDDKYLYVAAYNDTPYNVTFTHFQYYQQYRHKNCAKNCPSTVRSDRIDVYDKKSIKKIGEFSLENMKGIRNFFVENNLLYAISADGIYLYVFDLETRSPSNNFSIILERSPNRGFEINVGWAVGIHVDKGTSASNKNLLEYYRIYSCGYGSNNTINRSVSRVETVYSYASDTKSLAQISWKELF